MHRFYCPAPLEDGDVELPGSEATHLLRVLRLTEGEQVEVFDGRGHAAIALISAAAKRSVRLHIKEQLPPRVDAGPRVHLVTAAPKGDRLRWLVEKATELGVWRLSLIETSRSVVHPGSGKLEKLKAAVVAACKQSGRNDLMAIDPPRSWSQTLEELVDRPGRLLIASRGGAPLSQGVDDLASVRDIRLAIGPEGGWDKEEIELATSHGAVPIDLGPLILRIETAALATVSALRLHLRHPPTSI